MFRNSQRVPTARGCHFSSFFFLQSWPTWKKSITWLYSFCTIMLDFPPQDCDSVKICMWNNFVRWQKVNFLCTISIFCDVIMHVTCMRGVSHSVDPLSFDRWFGQQVFCSPTSELDFQLPWFLPIRSKFRASFKSPQHPELCSIQVLLSDDSITSQHLCSKSGFESLVRAC